MNLLPKWILPGTLPAIYDTESKTIQQQTARVYQKMNELIEDYNAFVDDVNSRITEHNDKMDHDLEVYAQSLRQEFQDFIDVCTLQLEEYKQELASNYVSKDTYDGLSRTVVSHMQQANEHMIEANKYFTGVTPVPKATGDKDGKELASKEYVDSMVEDLYATLNTATYGSGE